MENSISKDKVIVELSHVQVPDPNHGYRLKCPICGGPMGEIGPAGPYGRPGLVTLLGKCGHEESRGIRGPPGRGR